ncbi:MAG: sigma-54-dependent Fis family transcriptional regulator [Planctomycetota bacterium]|jgi:DNA-binding NtrC family response regulator
MAQLEFRVPGSGRSVVEAADETIPIGRDADGRATWGRSRVLNIVAEVCGDRLTAGGQIRRLEPGVPVEIEGIEVTFRASADARAAALNELGINLWSLETAESVFEHALDAMLDVLGVRRAAIALLDDDENELELRAVRGGLAALNPVVTRAVVESGAAVLSSEAAVDDHETDDELSIDVRAILCAPLRDEGRPQGVLYADNQGRPSIFTNDELDFAAALAHLVSFAFGNLHRKEENTRLKEALGLGERLILVSSSMKEIRAQIEKVAGHDATVLITGESGVGKELAAREIHRLSPRHAGPFIAVNCAAIPDTLLESELFGYAPKSAIAGADPAGRAGRFEQADGGTLFLDEIAEMKHELQAKLLRVLQDKKIDRLNDTAPRPVDVRIVVATNQNLAERVAEGRFREDLYYRLNVVSLRIPPLRRRREEIPLLAEFFIRTYPGATALRRAHLTAAAHRALAGHNWPGNIRELKNCIEQALILGDGKSIHLADLPPAVQDSARAPIDDSGDLEPLAEVEKRHIARVLAATGWNKTQAARVLGISKPTLYAKIKSYELRKEA